MARNVRRDELVDAMRAGVVQAWRHDPLVLWIGLIMLTNAVIFAILIQNPVGWKLGLWFVFCVASLSVAAVLEKARMARQSTLVGLHDQDVALCTDPASSRDDRPEVLTSVADR